MYPAIAEHLVFKVGFASTWRGMHCPPSVMSLKINELTVFAFVAFITLFPANFFVRQRLNAHRRAPQMDWDMFTEVPFLLMSAGK